MTTSRWQKARELFLGALELPAADRLSYLDAGADDADTRELVREMLVAHDADEAFLENPEHLPAGDRFSVLEPGSIFGGYIVAEVIGEGGMGIVYRAQKDGFTVALKLIRPGVTTPGTRRRFELEADVLGRLDHPGIAHVHDAGTADTEAGPQPYIAMEYIEGAPMLEYVRREDLNFQQRLELIVLVCDAVAHAHEKGVVHRDLKPSNILIARDGTPHVLDFGVARALEGDLVSTTLMTGAGQLIGSLAYMSPEQATGNPLDIDVRSDVYALGVLCYQLLVGRLPYPSGMINLPHAISQITSEDPVPISSVDPTVPEQVDVILEKALEKAKEHRYADAGELAADLRRYLGAEPIAARHAGSLAQIRRFTARNPILVATILIVALSLVAMTTATSWYAYLANKQRNQILRLADLHRLDLCVRNADMLWPELPEYAKQMQDWIDHMASPLRERLPFHRKNLDAVRAQGTHVSGDRWHFSDVETQWRHDQLVELVQGLEQLFEGGGGAEASLFEEMKRRHRNATTIRSRSVADPEVAALWHEAATAVRSSPIYAGFELTPQIGFVPLGPDATTGLWEFAHLRSGEVPVRVNGVFQLQPESGLVFVLLPGGKFFYGAQATDPDGRNYDPNAFAREAPIVEYSLTPFLLSKYELTQEIWQRFTGSNPSQARGELLPVEKVSWAMCRETLWRMGLTLPDEVQWEYAARAGTDTAWWTGANKESLTGTVNIADRYYRDHGPAYRKYELWLDDGYAAAPAPVHAYRPNPFGLYSILGNVWEWCREPTVRLGETNRPLLNRPLLNRMVPLRGGSWDSPAVNVRCAKQGRSAPSDQNHFTGVRPAYNLMAGGE
ncbi:MAG: bifunctional serine/threonine-protein kinase/formylglycine-generating enzyme family protein [Planctomycetota bacterium]